MKILTEVLELKLAVRWYRSALMRKFYETIETHGGEKHRGPSGVRRRPALRHFGRGDPYILQRFGATQLPSSAVSR